MSRSRIAVWAFAVATAVAVAKKAGKRVKRAKAVYVEEISSGARPIQAVGTAVAAFVGFAP